MTDYESNLEFVVRQIRERAVVPAVALALPVLLVNSIAVTGQVGWAMDNVTDHLAVAILFAAALESVGIYLAVESHLALMAGDSSAKLRIGSYVVALIVGGLNYFHHADHDLAPTAAAVAFGGMSAISPWLWSIRSRSMHRAKLRELDLIEPRAVKFSTARWVLYPVATFRAFRSAVWNGVTDPAEAIRATATKPAVTVTVREATSSQVVSETGKAASPTRPQLVTGPASTSSRRRGGDLAARVPELRRTIAALKALGESASLDQLAKEMRASKTTVQKIKALMDDEDESREVVA